MSVTLSFSRIWSYFVLFCPVPAPPGLARVPPGPPQASRGRFATGDRKQEKKREVIRFRDEWKRMENEWTRRLATFALDYRTG